MGDRGDGQAIHDLVAELYPLPRSLTGAGVRATLEIVARELGADASLTVHEVPSGTPVLDWTVPPEWNLRDAWIAAPDGTRVLDVAQHNLHVVGYSEPVQRRMTLAELRPHVHTLPDRPAWIPYRTSYYTRTWGFCMAADELAALEDGEYDVCIDAAFDDSGSLTYGELVLPGTTDAEFLVSTHVCHPSLANDNASGIAVATELAAVLAARADRRHTFRFLFVPGTIGSITWLAQHDADTTRIAHGLVLTGLGDRGGVTYKRSRRGDAPIDRAAEHVLRTDARATVVDFSPYGYDERQYCSPGFDLPVGRFGRSPHGEYPEYHTSADDLAFVDPVCLQDSFDRIVEIVDVVERDATFRNRHPKGEPQLGRRGLYRATGGAVDRHSTEMAFLWVLNLSDGGMSLLDIADRSGLPFDAVHRAAELLEQHELLDRL